ncbi:MAG: hypothetical protein RR540_06910, partial [Oscillospiraceae bacterium]
MAERTDCRLEEILRRAKVMQHSQENRLLAGFSCACVSLLCGFLGIIGSVSDVISQSGVVFGAYGTVLLQSGAVVFLFIGVSAFFAGIAVTILCVRYHRKNHQNAT